VKNLVSFFSIKMRLVPLRRGEMLDWTPDPDRAPVMGRRQKGGGAAGA
jgi:hypothetical protein